MNGLLLSMPGTPVLYYGDEIGMGDNIHLGDRDGVRTPMQWSVDRNGGFSRADPASLVLPPLMDPIYGYFALNVEAQSGDSHSLLNWARRMLAVRKRHISFGRGTQRFLYPSNRRILAYLREYSENGVNETILCVSNLSRTAQAVELDLHMFEGRIPVDVVGGSIFPAVGALTYLLTLPPYAFYWFLLAEKDTLPDWHAPSSEPLPELQTFVVRNSIAEIFENSKQRASLEAVLPEYLDKRRWFGSKGETIDEIQIAYGVPLDRRRNNRVALTEISARIGDRTENYVLPVGAVAENVTNPLVQQLALSRIRRVALVGFLTDGFASDDFTIALLDLIRREEHVEIEGGTIEFRKGPTFDALDLPDAPEIRRLSAEQSNSSQIISDLLVLKIVRKVLAGVHPEGEVTGYLTERGFTNTAPLFGEVVRVAADGTPHTLMLLQGFVRNQGDGWGWTLDTLARITDDIGMTDVSDSEAELLEHFEGYRPFSTAIGRRLAELHDVLSAPTDNPDFAPRVAAAAETTSWADGAIAQLDGALVLLGRFLEGDTSAAASGTVEMAERTIGRADALRDLIRRLAKEGIGALVTRVHGDFHLGQILVVGSDAYLIDFEGEPAKSMAERRAHSSPMRDVAGILRSFDYAASSARIRAEAAPGLGAERQLAALDAFRRIATASFQSAYDDVLAASAHPWVSPSAQGALLDLFLIEKAAYEIRYEASNRPAWLPIPLRGLDEIATRLLD
jgi:maltose alpha-D-glucosyltransferase/alpha-amylase